MAEYFEHFLSDIRKEMLKGQFLPLLIGINELKTRSDGGL